MAQHKKYDYRIVEQEKGWAAEITRRASAKKTVISKRQDGFDSEAAAKAWAEAELKVFLANLQVRNQREAKKRGE